MILKIKKIDKNARLPVYGHSGDAGLDLFSAVDFVLQAGEIHPVPTGIQAEIPLKVSTGWPESSMPATGEK
jgi:dUTP pyrophosphatase